MSDIDLSLIDLKALSEPACKLIEAVRSAVGLLYEPRHVRRMAKAEKEAAITRAEGEVEAAIIRVEGAEEVREIALRAFARRNNLELRRQRNIESITGKALKELPESVSEEKVDEDWIMQFFNYCQDISNEEMQTLWARLLAGEVARPGSYSLRTLQLVRMFDKSDAELFTHFCSYVWCDSRQQAFGQFHNDQIDELLRSKDFPHPYCLHLESLGLIDASSTVALHPEPDQTLEFFYYGKRHLVTSPGPYKRAMLVHLLTDIGQELAPISGSESDEEYRAALVESWIREGMTVQVSDDAKAEPNIT